MKFLGQISTYTIIGFLGAGANFLLFPYLSHFLSPADYGILSMINSLITILIPFTSIMAFSWISTEYFKIKDKSEFASLFSTVQLVPVIPFLMFLILCLLFKNALGTWLEIPPEKNYWIVIAALLAFLTIYFETLINFTVTQQKPGDYAFFNVVKLFIEIGLTVFFVTRLRLGWEGRLFAWLVSSVVCFGAGLLYFTRRHLITLRIRKSFFFSSIHFGAPLILHNVGKFIINQSDRIFITKMVSLEEAGIYSIGYQVGFAILLFVNAAGNFFQPYLFERLEKSDKHSQLEIVKTTYLIVSIFVVALVGLSVCSGFLFDWFIDERYSQGNKYVFWVGLSYVFWGIYILMTGYIFFSGNTRFLGNLAILNVVLNGTLNYFLIDAFGAMGAAYATCLSFFVVAVLVAYKANSLYPMPWGSFRKIVDLKNG